VNNALSPAQLVSPSPQQEIHLLSGMPDAKNEGIVVKG
jgi:hypothetical protein